MKDEARNLELAVLVNAHASPFAILLICLGISISKPPSPERELCIGLLVFGIVFNIAFVRWIKSRGEAKSNALRARLAVNLAVNTAQVFLLGPFWPPCWLLLALTPMAESIYGGRGEAWFSSLAACGILLAVNLAWGGGALEWGQAAAQAAFIVMMSLLINAIARK